jgi:hypothetical protein
LPGSRSDDCNFVYFESKEVYVRNLEEFELAAVSGGDHWGYENADGSIDESNSSAAAASYSSLGNIGSSTPNTAAQCWGDAVAGGAAGATAAKELMDNTKIPKSWAAPVITIGTVVGAGYAVYTSPNCAQP